MTSGICTRGSSTFLIENWRTEKRKLEDQLDELGRRFGGSPKDIPQRRPYPKVEPKFRNPNDPSETWSGRGKTPRWMIEMIADGRSIDDFRIQ